MVRQTSRDKGAIANPQEIVDGLRSGNSFASSGQLIDRLAFVACSDNRFKGEEGAAELEAIALEAAKNGTEVNINANCAVMGEKLKINNNDDVVVAVVVRDPSGTNYSPYTFANPSLLQISKTQPLNQPELDHFDVISGLVTGAKKPSAPEYSGQWPDNWVDNPDMNTVPAGAKNTSAGVIKTFGNGTWHVGWRIQGRIVPSLRREGFAVPAPARQQPAGFRALRDRCERQSVGGHLHQRERSFEAAYPVHDPLTTADSGQHGLHRHQHRRLPGPPGALPGRHGSAVRQL